jgi:hypothetical protein
MKKALLLTVSLMGLAAYAHADEVEAQPVIVCEINYTDSSTSCNTNGTGTYGLEIDAINLVDGRSTTIDTMSVKIASGCNTNEVEDPTSLKTVISTLLAEGNSLKSDSVCKSVIDRVDDKVY